MTEPSIEAKDSDAVAVAITTTPAPQSVPEEADKQKMNACSSKRKRLDDETDDEVVVVAVKRSSTIPESVVTSALEAKQLPMSRSVLPSTLSRQLSISSSPASALAGKEGVCLIEVATVQWMWEEPWQRSTQSRSTGSGFVISNRRILTNCHVVHSAIDIRVRLHGSPRRFAAKVLVQAPDVDLAILTIDGDEAAEEFFGTSNNSSLELELADDLPRLQESVHVVGFPTGGRTVCVTEGVVSRIDSILLEAPADTILAIQIDAAINPGNSGGPAFNSRGQVTGVAFCKDARKQSDNIGYVIPAAVVRAFLGRISVSEEVGTCTYTLSPSIPYRWHSLENTSLRMAHNVPKGVHGILIVDAASAIVKGALQKGDVLTKIDGTQLADDGQLTLRGQELIQHNYLLRGKQLNEPTVFSVYRDGKHLSNDGPNDPPCVLKDLPYICPRWADVDHQPDYLILGALVLVPMSLNLMSSKHAGKRLVATCKDWCLKWQEEESDETTKNDSNDNSSKKSGWGDKEELVVLTDIFAHELSFSYSRPWRRVVSYNGTSIRSLCHLKDIWLQSCKKSDHDTNAASPATPTTTKIETPQNCTNILDDNNKKTQLKEEQQPIPSFARIELEHDDDIIFEVSRAVAAQRDIMETHQIAKPWRICGKNPKYK